LTLLIVSILKLLSIVLDKTYSLININISGKVITAIIMSEKEIISADSPERALQEKCGIVGIYSPGSSILEQFDTGTIASRALWHRGQHGLGFTINTDQGRKKYLRIGTIDQALPPELRNEFEKAEGISDWALFHTRYGTSGNYDENNLQPISVRTPEGMNFSVTHNGEFTINQDIRDSIRENIPDGASDTYIFAKTLQYSPGSTPDEKIMSVLQRVNGAYSLLIGTDDALFAARDQFGIRPMVIGKYQNGFIIASETHALDKLGIDTDREIKRGEIIKIDRNGPTVIKKGSEGAGNFCSLELAYFSRPDSTTPTFEQTDDANHPDRWMSHLRFRETSGLILAREKPVKNVTLVVGVPDSGVPVGTGYARGINAPYRQVILRDHYDQNGQVRTFMKDNQMTSLSKMVAGKLSLVPDPIIWKDAIIVVVDDSMIRGSTSKPINKIMFDAGAKEVHWRLGFPQVKFPCHLGVSMRTDDELIANRHNGDDKEIAKEIGATSVGYISNEGFIKARLEHKNLFIPNNPKEIFLANNGCGGCVTGIYPISKDGTIYKRK